MLNQPQLLAQTCTQKTHIHTIGYGTRHKITKRQNTVNAEKEVAVFVCKLVLKWPLNLFVIAHFLFVIYCSVKVGKECILPVAVHF